MAGFFEAKEELEKLYLLEILVDSLDIDQTKLEDLTPEDAAGTELVGNCVIFQFLNHPPLEICSEDFCSDESKLESQCHVDFRNGKSCLFSLNRCARRLKYFKIRVHVLRKRDDPPHYYIAKGCITLDERFLKILNSAQSNSDDPLSECVKDQYELCNFKNEPIGKLIVFIRLSCFGKMIVTQFHITDEEKEGFLFKGNVNETVKSCNKIEDPSGPCDTAGGKPLPCSTRQSPIPKQESYPRYPNMHNRPLPPGGLLGGAQAPMGYGAFHAPMSYGPYQGPQCGFQGGNSPFGAQGVYNINQFMAGDGGSMAQKMPQGCGKIPVDEESSDSEEDDEQPIPSPMTQLKLCECDYPLPAGFGLPRAPPKKKKKKKKKKKSKCPFEAGGYGMFQGQRNKCSQFRMEPDTIAMMEDKVILQMPSQPYASQKPFFPHPMQGFGAPYAPQAYGAPYPQQSFGAPSYPFQSPGPCSGMEPQDPYSLRVGRTITGQLQTTKAEVSFQKLPDQKKRVCKHHEETQYLPSDFGGASDAGGDKKKGADGKEKGKGKDAKGKAKGKKGKK